MFELLAPAGNIERLKIALLYGADAVYVGGRDFSLRANAINFSREELDDAIMFAHKYNKKVYVTVNIVFHDNDYLDVIDYLKYLSSISVDGVIVSDLSIVDIIKDNNIDLFVVLSTQASVFNEYSTRFWQSNGVKRVVLARECNKDEIKRIIDNTGIEVECFIHGAMCTSFSGRCVLSNVTTNRDANRGGCAQVCRWCFDNKDKPQYSLMSKDLNMIAHIKEMMDMGVYSYKVEGRMRSIYYLATVVGVYRAIFDKIINNTLTSDDEVYYLNILNRVANRESKAQFFDSLPNHEDEYFFGRSEVTNKDFLGVVKSFDMDTNVAIIEQRNYFKKGDVVEFFNPLGEVYEYVVDTIYDKDDNVIEVSNHPQMIVKLKLDFEVCEFDMMRLKVIDK